jgi:hypothetical protein
MHRFLYFWKRERVGREYEPRRGEGETKETKKETRGERDRG